MHKSDPLLMYPFHIYTFNICSSQGVITFASGPRHFYTNRSNILTSTPMIKELLLLLLLLLHNGNPEP